MAHQASRDGSRGRRGTNSLAETAGRTEGARTMERMLTAREIANSLGVHENWVYDRAASGELPSYKLGGNRRFRPSEVEAWVNECLRPKAARAASGRR